MKKNVSKKLWLLAVVVLLAALLAIPALAADNAPEEGNVAYPEIAPKAYPKRYGAVDAGGYYTDALRDYLIGQFANCPSSINISSYNIPTSKIDEIRGCIWYETPEAFNVNGIGYTTSGNKIASLTLTYYSYSDTASEYRSCWNACVAAADKILDGIKGNNALTNVQKALLLHDRLAVWVEYDYENYEDYDGDLAYMPDTDFTMVGVFRERMAVCQGYTMAYMYLLDQVGIESDYCSSDALCHCWNIVYIGSTPYHVDVTWDDPVWDVTGRVDHYNFLRSTDGIVDTGHYYVDAGGYWIDFDDTPSSTTYDNYYWQDSNTAFQLLNGQIYYLDNEAAYIKKESNKSNVLSVDASWIAYSNSVWVGNFARLSATETELLYSLNDGIYAYNPTTGSNRKIYSPSLNSGYSVFGFMYEDGKLIYEQYLSPDYQRYTKMNYQREVSYNSPVVDNTAPTGSLSATNNLSASQTVTISMSDNVGIAGYYWGTNASYASNTYYSTSSGTATKTVNTNGTYYLTVKDTAGNISSTYSITFYKTTLNGNGGSVTPSYVITKSGNNFRLPAATRSNYTMLGWSTSSSASTASYSVNSVYTPSTNRTLYAVWQVGVAKNGWVEENGNTYYYVDNVKQTGWLELDGNRYYLGTDGARRKGWQQVDGYWYFFNKDCIMQTGWVQSGSIWYYCKADGKMATGWCQVGGVWYFFKTDGVMHVGWLQQGNIWYYLQSSGAMATGLAKVGGVYYRFDSNGVWKPGALSGWVQDSGYWYYISGNNMAKGWKQVGGAWYYFNSTGKMLTGWQTIGGRQYYLKSSGAMAVGWCKISGEYYYFDANGYMKKGWVQDGGTWYYMTSDGTMATGYWEIGNDTYYYFRDSGAMVTGWLKVGSYWYYFESSGAQAFGWKTIGSSTYFFRYDRNGEMATDCWVYNDDYNPTRWYFCGSDGVKVVNKWYRIDGFDYYFDSNGLCTNYYDNYYNRYNAPSYANSAADGK